jgi:hypothetical protein
MVLALAVAMVLFVIVVGTAIERARLRRIADSRIGEDFSTFRAAFEGKVVPENVLRAVYDVLGRWQDSSGSFPVRGSDSVAAVYGLVDEDLDWTIGEILAACGRRFPRSLEELRREKIPIRVGRIQIDVTPEPDVVWTVRDLVEYVNACPVEEGDGAPDTG